MRYILLILLMLSLNCDNKVISERGKCRQELAETSNPWEGDVGRCNLNLPLMQSGRPEDKNIRDAAFINCLAARSRVQNCNNKSESIPSWKN